MVASETDGQALYRAALDGSTIGIWPAEVLRRLLREVLAGVPVTTAARALDHGLRRAGVRGGAPSPAAAFWPGLAHLRTRRRRLAEAAACDTRQLAAIVDGVLDHLEGHGRPGIRRRIVEALVADRLGAFIEAVNATAAEARTVVFVTSRTDYKPLREAHALREHGFRCYLVCLEPLPEFVRAVFEETFDLCAELPLSPLMLGRLVARLRPEVFHVHCAMWHYVLSGVVMDEAGDAVVVCEYSDITSFYSPYNHMARHFPKDDVDLDIAMERRALEEADLVVHQCDSGVEPIWREWLGGSVPMLEFQPYPLTAWTAAPRPPISAQDGVIRMVWAGQVPGRVSCPPEQFDAYYLGEAVESLLRQGFGVVVYQNPMFNCDFSDRNFTFYGELAEHYPRFSIRPGLRVDRLGEELAQYDFGIILFEFDYTDSIATPEKNATLLPNKLFAYLEGGIPVIVPAEYAAMAEFVASQGLGFAVASNEIRAIAEQVAAFDVEAAKARIREYQRSHCMEREIARLVAAYDGVTAQR